MNHKRITALLLAAVLAVSLAACGERPKADPVDTPTTTTTTATVAKPTYYVTATSLNVRKGPGADREIVGSLYSGDVVEVLAIEDGWCRILYEGQEAYVSADYISDKAPTTTTTEVTTTTTTTTATTKVPTTQSPTYTDRFIDENGMLQFETGDNYVQAKNYADAAAIPWNLLLVNDWNPMQEGYDEAVTMKKLETKYAQVNGNQRVDARMYDDLIAMLTAGKAYNIGVQSSYRPYAKQKELYWRQVDKWKSKYSDPSGIADQGGRGGQAPRLLGAQHRLGGGPLRQRRHLSVPLLCQYRRLQVADGALCRLRIYPPLSQGQGGYHRRHLRGMALPLRRGSRRRPQDHGCRSVSGGVPGAGPTITRKTKFSKKY